MPEQILNPTMSARNTSAHFNFKEKLSSRALSKTSHFSTFIYFKFGSLRLLTYLKANVIMERGISNHQRDEGESDKVADSDSVKMTR